MILSLVVAVTVLPNAFFVLSASGGDVENCFAV